MEKITGETLISWGFNPNKDFRNLLVDSNKMRESGLTDEEIKIKIKKILNKKKVKFQKKGVLEVPSPNERYEIPDKVSKNMCYLTELPTVLYGTICTNSSPKGLLPIGCAITTEDSIHPGLLPQDLCCSIACTSLLTTQIVPVSSFMDKVMEVVHFGSSRRKLPKKYNCKELTSIIKRMKNNKYTKGLEELAKDHFMTHGSGNHSFIFSTVASYSNSNKYQIITNFGARGIGAKVRKRALSDAIKYTSGLNIKPNKVLKEASWFPKDSYWGKEFMVALEIIRDYVRLSHFKIHETVLKNTDYGFVVEFESFRAHNFLHKEEDGKLHHCNGLIPNFNQYPLSYKSEEEYNDRIRQLRQDQYKVVVIRNLKEGCSLIKPRRTQMYYPYYIPNGYSRILPKKYKSSTPITGSEFYIKNGDYNRIDIRWFSGRVDWSQDPVNFNFYNADNLYDPLRIQILGVVMNGSNN